MMKKITLILVLIVLVFYSCSYSKKEHNIDETNNQIKCKINDSIDIKIFYTMNSSTISTIIIKNNQSGICNIYGFHKDGITPTLIGASKNEKLIGVYYTYYSNGKLNNKVNYIDGELDGEYVSFSENGEIIYKAHYEKGIEKRVEIYDSTSNIEIEEIEE